MTVVDPLSAFLTVMLLLRDGSLSAFCSPNNRLSLGLSSLISARSNLTSPKKVSKLLWVELVALNPI